ncbi:MAG: homocysteine biosynthesis protein [Armatimonadota bacterium]
MNPLAKTFAEINDRIRKGEAVVVTAEEMIEVVAEKGTKKAAEEVDVVTTGTFGPMCSSGAFINVGHTKPRMKIQKAWINRVPAYAGLAAVDLYIGATEMAEDDPLNADHPGEVRYGGGHVIQDLIAGKDVRLQAIAYGTDCYPRRELDTWLNIKDLNEAILCNPRNAYQNYNVAVNAHADREIYTYMGVLKPRLGNANFCSAGQLSPLLKDPYYRTIGIGTRIFLGGAHGFVFWQGTQHNPTVPRNEHGVPKGGAGTLAVVGDMKRMSPKWVVGVSFYGYGVSLNVGIGVPIPILDEEMARFTALTDADLVAPITDYSRSYPSFEGEPLGLVSYAELKSGEITVNGKKVPTVPLSSYRGAQAIASTLKEWIRAGQFLLGEPVEPIPSADSGLTFKPLTERPAQEGR